MCRTSVKPPWARGWCTTDGGPRSQQLFILGLPAPQAIEVDGLRRRTRWCSLRLPQTESEMMRRRCSIWKYVREPSHAHIALSSAAPRIQRNYSYVYYSLFAHYWNINCVFSLSWVLYAGKLNRKARHAGRIVWLLHKLVRFLRDKLQIGENYISDGCHTASRLDCAVKRWPVQTCKIEIFQQHKISV